MQVAWMVCGDAVEGGLDDGRGPSTNWRPSIATRQVPPPEVQFDAVAPGGYEAIWAAAAANGVAAIAWQPSWARLAPTAGHWDEDVATRYREALRCADDLGLTVHLVAVGTSWPSWLGPEAMLLPWTRPVVVSYCEQLATLAVAPTSQVLAFVGPDHLVQGGYQLGIVPPFRRRATADARALRAALDDIALDVRTRLGDVAMASPATCSVSGPRPTSSRTPLVVQSLVAGHGPYGTAEGLLRLVDGSFVVDDRFRHWLVDVS
jgi:hypothetical protein